MPLGDYIRWLIRHFATYGGPTLPDLALVEMCWEEGMLPRDAAPFIKNLTPPELWCDFTPLS